MNGTIRLDARLSAIRDMVDPCNLTADIGCDHGYLICELVRSGISQRGLACEANPGPLANASRTIRENCLSDKIDTVLTNGLTNLPFSTIDTFIIAGMGGDLIAEILSAAPQIRHERFHFILQPMTKHENLRRMIFENGFIIRKEEAVMCDNKVYTVMYIKYTQSSHDYDISSFYTGLLQGSDDSPAGIYLEKTAKNLEKKAKGSKLSGNSDLFDEYMYLARKVRERIY